MNLTRAEILALVAMAFGVFMDGLDASIVNIALPSIAESFGADANSVAWVTIVYFMMNAGLMLSFGRLSDSGHIKKVYIAGFAIFALSSLACGLSWDLGSLVASRIAQGLGAAMLAAVAPMICVRFLSRDKLGLGMSILMLSGAVGFCSGPIVGGVLVDVASWHWAFFINVPIGIGAVALAMRCLPKDRETTASKLDLKGTALLFVAVICGVYAMEMFSREGQGMICIALTVAMVLCLVLLVHVERRAAHPMLDIGMFRDWRFDSSVLTYLMINICYMGIAYIIPFYMTKELGLSYTFAGLLILIPSVVVILVSVPIGRYGDIHGRRMLSIMATVVLLASAIFYAVLVPEMGWLPFVAVGIMGGVVWGLCGAVASRIVDLSPESERGMASTLSNFLYYTGGSIGTAMFASLVTLGSGTAGIPIDLISPEEFMDGYTFAMIFAVVASVLAVISAAIVNEKKVKLS